MGTYTRENTEIAVDLDGMGRQHRAESGGMVIALERWQAGLDTADMFADLPDGACQESHWGYVLSGSVTMRYTDGQTETLSAGQAYYIRPGHNAHVDDDVEVIEFTPADQSPGINTLEKQLSGAGDPG
jgi:hypothetical protein